MSLYNMYGLGSLGSLPAQPSNLSTIMGGQLQPNHQWVRYYENDYNHQLTSCPKNPPFGCWIIGGYAWGQREWYPPEFQPHGWVIKPLPAPFPPPPPIKRAPAPAVLKPTAPKPAPKPAPPPAILAPKPVAKKTPVIAKSAPAPVVIVPPIPATPSVVMDQPTPKTDTAQHVGGVVGIGLVIATVLTLLRKYPQAMKRK